MGRPRRCRHARGLLVVGLLLGCPGLVLDVDALWRELEQAVAEGS